MYKATKTVGADNNEKIETYEILAHRRLFFKVDKRKSVLAAMRPILKENNVTYRVSFEEWCDQYAYWADCPFLNFCQRVQGQFDFKRKRCCYECQIISEKLYNDKKFVDFVDYYSDKNDSFLAREISSGRLAYLVNFNKDSIKCLSVVKISKDDFRLLDFEKPNNIFCKDWPVLDENLKVVKPGFSDPSSEGGLVKVESLDIAGGYKSGAENDTQVDNSVTAEQLLFEDSKNSTPVFQPEKKENDKIGPKEGETSTGSRIGERGREEKIHDTRSFFYLSFQGGNKTSPERMTTIDACTLALAESRKKGVKISLFKKTRAGEKEIDWVNHRLISDDDLPDFIKGKKVKKITPSVTKKAKSTSGANEKSLLGARYFRLEWPGGSLGLKRMFVSDACALASQKAEEIGDPDKVKLFKVTLKNGKEEEFNWSGKNTRPRPGQEEVKKGVGINISMFGNKKDAKTRNIKISGNFFFKFDVNIDID